MSLQLRCIGSLRPTHIRPYPHGHSSFTGSRSETAPASLPHSITTIISGQSTLLPSHGQCYRGHSLGGSNLSFHLNPSTWSIGQCSPPIPRLSTLQGAVLLLDSRTGPFPAPGLLHPGPLLPKLRGQLAEFLRTSSTLPLGTHPYLPVLVSGTVFPASPLSWASLSWIPTTLSLSLSPLRSSKLGSFSFLHTTSTQHPPLARPILSRLAFQLSIKVRLTLFVLLTPKGTLRSLAMLDLTSYFTLLVPAYALWIVHPCTGFIHIPYRLVLCLLVWVFHSAALLLTEIHLVPSPDAQLPSFPLSGLEIHASVLLSSSVSTGQAGLL